MNDFNGVDYNLIDMNVLKTIFEQAEKKLEETAKTGEILTDRAYNIVQIFSAFCIGCVAFLLSNKEAGLDEINILCFFGIIWSFIILFKGIYVWRIYSIRTPGINPESLMKIDYTIYKNQESSILVGMIHSVKKSISDNIEINGRRGKKIKDAIKITYWGLGLGAVYASIFTIF